MESVGEEEDELIVFVRSLRILKTLSQYLEAEDFTFVSLQYGPVAEDIKQFKSLGVDVHHDELIDPIKDMESWLNQVAACDAVLSVANTTVHGSGGLDIPTMCLLSWRSDWRWLEESDVKRSYWYPSVGIARASKHNDGYLR